jgi:hypothetical protein
MAVPLATRERVTDALDIDHTAYRGPQVDQALDAASREIELGLHWAHFHPVIATRLFDWSNLQHAEPWRLWLDDQPLVSVTSMTSGGVTVDPADLVLEPVNAGPPYTRVEMDLAGSSSFDSGSTRQQSVAITGLWGHRVTELAAGALAAALVDTTGTTVDLTRGDVAGIGSLLRVDTERMAVTGRTWLDTTANLNGDLTAADNATLLVPSAGTYWPGERLMLGAEEMRVRAQTAAGVVVQRATGGTVLAAHTGAVDIYAQRRYTVTRGAEGTTAATHLLAAAAVVWQAPAPVEALCVALAMNQVEQELGAYRREVTAPGGAAPGGSLGDLWMRAARACGRAGSRKAAI